MGSILAFFMGPIGSKLLLGVALAGLIYIGITQYNHNIRATQMLTDQNAQLVQLQKDQQTLNKKMDSIDKINRDILTKLDEKNGKVVETHDKVTTYITSPEGQKSNRPASDVIRTTIGILRNEK